MADANIEPERGRKIAFRASPEIIAEIEPSRRLRVYRSRQLPAAFATWRALNSRSTPDGLPFISGVGTSCRLAVP